METAREIFDFYIPKLIMKMKDPNPLIKEMNGKVKELKEQGKI